MNACEPALRPCSYPAPKKVQGLAGKACTKTVQGACTPVGATKVTNQGNYLCAVTKCSFLTLRDRLNYTVGALRELLRNRSGSGTEVVMERDSKPGTSPGVQAKRDGAESKP